MIKFDFTTYTKHTEQEQRSYEETIKAALGKLDQEETMTDWRQIETCVSKKELDQIKQLATMIQKKADIFLVIGIGGSFLGSKAVIEALSPYYNTKKPEIIFLGTNLSSDYLTETLAYCKNKEIYVNVISKSGTTLETSIAFTACLNQLKEQYKPEELKEHIIATTDEHHGALRAFVEKYQCQSFLVPQNIGGRYSVLSPVGLLPIAVAGYNIHDLLRGAKVATTDCIEEACDYAISRRLLKTKKKAIESFTIYEPKLASFTEWLKQLFAESHGKNGKGIFPVSSINTRDLHSLGQFYQDGSNILFETVILVKKSKYDQPTNYTQSLNEINNLAAHQVAIAHVEGDTPSNFIEMDELNEFNLGYLIYFFETACALGGYLLNVNPFDQPGVETYKKYLVESLGERK